MLAIIPARGGSKGLPGKNIRDLNGKPLIAYTIEAALNSEMITKVIVSTDSKEIASIAKKYGAEVPFMRPDSLATDSSKSIDVYLYTLKRLENDSNIRIEEFIILQPTSPLRGTKSIDAAINLFKNKDADSVVSYCKEEHPIKWHKYITKEGKLKEIFKDKIRNRQDEKPTYYPNGAIFIFKRYLVEAGKYYSFNSYAYEMSRKQSIDIDYLEDFEYVEFLLKRKNA